MSDHYRRRRGGRKWHFCTNCTDWPDSGFDSRASKPKADQICKTCHAKHNDGVCDHAWLDVPA
ncbi:MAG: hypothetical protein KY397_06120 [Gemmatimonadetes bacterium]|nr:hypothetical protein [Gemmatimonadota bacterium]